MDFISIHAPREGSDGVREPGAGGHPHFYPRSPRGERLAAQWLASTAGLFLSTLPARGATPRVVRLKTGPANFYPRSPRGERRSPIVTQLSTPQISIHAPREGSDSGAFFFLAILIRFLSTLPARGATRR